MASVGGLLSEEQLLCPICLDVFTQPVSTPCGHNFCRDCIQGYWRSIPVSHCPMCKQTFYRRPELKVNTFISELAAQFRRTVEMGADERTSATSSRSGEVVLCDVCNGKSVKALKSCLDCLASFCETHLAPHRILGTFKRHRLIDPVMDMQDRVCQKHERLLELFCNTDRAYVCRDCVETDHRAHATVPIETESRERRARLKEIDTEVQENIQGRLQKIGEIRHAVELSRTNTERETEDSLQVFAAMLLCVQRGQAELVGAIEGKQREAERRAEGIIKDLEQETAELSRWSAELERLTNTDDHLHLLQRFPTIISATPPVTKEWSEETAVESAVYVGTVRRAVRRVGSQLEEMLKAQVSRLCETEFQRVRLCEVDVTLDPDTAHPKLILSADGKRVHHGDHVTLGSGRINDNNPKRFYPGLSVLGEQGFTSGKFYYEVQVKGKTEWDVGVCLESVNRKGGDTLNPEGGYWSVGLRNHGKQYWALASPAPVHLPLEDKPQRVGLYVDVENGQVSFYNVASRSHIYTFTGYSFGERVFPYFNPRRNHGGVNSAPLIISPVSQSD